jgi:hypothetical protein
MATRRITGTSDEREVGDSARWKSEEAVRQAKEALDRVLSLEQVVERHSTTIKTQMCHIEGSLKEQCADLKMLVGSELRRSERELMAARFNAFSRWVLPLIFSALGVLVAALWWIFNHAK